MTELQAAELLEALERLGTVLVFGILVYSPMACWATMRIGGWIGWHWRQRRAWQRRCRCCEDDQ